MQNEETGLKENRLFNSTASNDEGRFKVRQVLSDLKVSPGWQFLISDLSRLKYEVEQEIFESDGENTPIYSKSDLKKHRRKLIERLMNLPDYYIQALMNAPQREGRSLEDGSHLGPQELDPFNEPWNSSSGKSFSPSFDGAQEDPQ